MVVCADEGPDLLCLLFFLFSLVDSCLDLRKPSVSSSDGGRVVVMFASYPSYHYINSNEDVPTHSSFPRVCPNSRSAD